MPAIDPRRMISTWLHNWPRKRHQPFTSGPDMLRVRGAVHPLVTLQPDRSTQAVINVISERYKTILTEVKLSTRSIRRPQEEMDSICCAACSAAGTYQVV